MSVSPLDFLDSANAMSVNSDEMSKRNSLSRAYYAAYHHAYSAIPCSDEACEDRTKGMHRTYINELMSSYDSATVERRVGVKLNTLYARRIRADYRLNETVDSRTVSMQLDCARQVFELITENYEPSDLISTAQCAGSLQHLETSDEEAKSRAKTDCCSQKIEKPKPSFIRIVK